MATNVFDVRGVEPAARRPTRDHRFFLAIAIAVVLVNVAAFSMQAAMGRSTFAAPWHVHLHAIVFFGFVTLYLCQNILVAMGALRWHRTLGWISVGWMVAMAIAGSMAVAMLVRTGRVPFFFTPAYFLAMDGLALVTFLALAGTAVRMRRRTEWHRRLMASAMSAIMGPAFGRLLPLPLLIPYAGLAVFPTLLAIPVAGAIYDRRTRGAVHPAWWWGIGALTLTHLLIELCGRGALGAAAVMALSAGMPGATVDPLAYPPFPPLP
ncbi:hypothetical protein [Sphingomonas sp.]|jgi:hypothetical protein|uniref:hypothetical protein n=1 Tax=Sphingomonas sp. TaxID=28214 RepID=UPI0035C7D810